MAGSTNHHNSPLRQTPTPHFSRPRPCSPTHIRVSDITVVDGIPPYTQQCLELDDRKLSRKEKVGDDPPWPIEPQFSIDFGLLDSNQSNGESSATSLHQVQKPRVTVNTRCTARTIEGTPIVTFISTTSIIAPPTEASRSSSPITTTSHFRPIDQAVCNSDDRSEEIASPAQDEYLRDIDSFPAPATYTVTNHGRPSLVNCRNGSGSSSCDSMNTIRQSNATPTAASISSLQSTLQDTSDDRKSATRPPLSVHSSRGRSNSDISLICSAQSRGKIFNISEQPTPPPRTSSKNRTGIHPAYRRVEWSDSREFDSPSRLHLQLSHPHTTHPGLQHRRHTSDLETQRRRNQEPLRGILKPSRDADGNIYRSTASKSEESDLNLSKTRINTGLVGSVTNTSNSLTESSPISLASSHDTYSSFYSIYRHGRHSHSTSSNTSTDTTASSAPSTIVEEGGEGGDVPTSHAHNSGTVISNEDQRNGGDFDRSEFYGFYGTQPGSNDRSSNGGRRVVTIRTSSGDVVERGQIRRNEAKSEDQSRSSTRRRSFSNMITGHKEPKTHDSSKNDKSPRSVVTTASSTSPVAPPPSPTQSPLRTQSRTIIHLVPPASTPSSSQAPHLPPLNLSVESPSPVKKIQKKLTQPQSSSQRQLKSSKKPFIASTFDYSTLLTEAEAARLRSRGVNPALWAEMRAMRKGKGKGFGALVGNAYVS